MKRSLVAVMSMMLVTLPAFGGEIAPPPALPFHLSPQERSVLSAERNELSGAYLALTQKRLSRDTLCRGAQGAACRAQSDSLTAQKERYDDAVDAFSGRVRDTRNARPGFGQWTPLEP